MRREGLRPERIAAVTRHLAPALLALALPCPALASGTARVCVSVEGAAAQGRLQGARWARPATLELPPGRTCFLDVPAGEQRLTVRTADPASGPSASLPLLVLPGEELELEARAGADAPVLTVTARGRRGLGTGFDTRRIRDLPGSGEPWSLIETVERRDHRRPHRRRRPVGRAARAVQRPRQLLDADVLRAGGRSTRPTRSTTGTPLGWPALAGLDAFDVATAALPAEAGAPGAYVTLQPSLPPRALVAGRRRLDGAR